MDDFETDLDFGAQRDDFEGQLTPREVLTLAYAKAVMWLSIIDTFY